MAQHAGSGTICAVPGLRDTLSRSAEESTPARLLSLCTPCVDWWCRPQLVIVSFDVPYPVFASLLLTPLDGQVIADARRITGEPDDSTYVPRDASEFCGRIFHTTYMGTENSSRETRARAKQLASDIGAYHVDLNMDTLVSAVVTLFATYTGKTPRFRVHGGSSAENLALQNIQARLRMVLAYLFAQLLPWVRGKMGALLVLGSANVDER